MFSRTFMLILLFSVFSLPSYAAKYYLRADGGNKLECSGLFDEPKKADKKCAWSMNVLGMSPVLSKGDQLQISGTKKMILTFEPEETYKVKTDFTVFKNHISFYFDKTFLGQIITIKRAHKGQSPDLFQCKYIGKDK